jgi:NAD(P)-dependent dehydrogenase (short-subunit alcohol dehydrogenase family)
MPSPDDLADRIGIVTGAGSGIGREVVRLAADHGAHVVGIDIDADGLSATAGLVTGTGDFTQQTCDVTDPDSVADALTDVLAGGRIDFLVNCAGTEGPVARFLDTSPDDLEHVLRVNVRGTFVMMQAAAPTMIAAQRGSIVNIASIAALGGFAFMSAYAASKHAILGLTRVAVAEFAPANVRVNAVCPGSIDTGMHTRAERSAADPVAFRTAEEQAVPQGRLGTAQEVAEVVRFLLTDRSPYVNGAAITVDGGWTATL